MSNRAPAASLTSAFATPVLHGFDRSQPFPAVFAAICRGFPVCVGDHGVDEATMGRCACIVPLSDVEMWL